MYTMADYWTMMADDGRRSAYAEALSRSVRPGASVVNIGAGTGVFALLASQLGAGRVYAIEPDDIIDVARILAAANGFGNTIELIQQLSTDVTLPEPGDVVVSDLRGVLPLLGHHIPSIVDARRRLLAQGGVLIPRQDVIWAAVVEAPDLYDRVVTPWGRDTHDLDFDALRELAVNRWSKVRVRPDQLLSAAQEWAMLDYERIEDPNVQGTLRWVLGRPGTAHGLCLWFETTLIEGVSFSTGPDQPERVYGSGLFPFAEPVDVETGDAISVDLSASLVGDEYLWRWSTRVQEADGRGNPKAQFEQSNFRASPLTPSTLRKQSTRHVPVLNRNGEVDRAILAAIRGEESLQQIAEAVAEQFPSHFGGWRDVLPHVQRLSMRYSL